ncbi:hypothetical protein B0H13DRAFT_1927339 [Mycena leptocephala]|nr:hypothetical protein B0H13DRAFT_1927339 [Mycena leptocephala]
MPTEYQQYTTALAQVATALAQIRHHLLVRTHLVKAWNQNARGFQAHARANRQIQRCNERIRHESTKYSDSRTALEQMGSLLGRTEWASVFKPILPTDIVSIDHPCSSGAICRVHGNQGCTVSWIWVDLA